MRTLVIGTLSFALVVFLALTAAWADDDKEEKVPLDKLPRAVTDAVKAKFDGAELVSASKEKDNGKDVYEVAIKHKGSNIDVSLTPEGKIVSIEKEIAAKDLPKAVSEALDAKYPKATIKKLEEVTENDKVVYEALLVTAEQKTVEAVFDPSGKLVKEEKKEKKE
jgi:hypothetical protein